MPEVGPELGADQPPTHYQLLARLEGELSAGVWESAMYPGWLELRAGKYRLSPQPGDGYVDGPAALSATDRAEMVRSLTRWANRAGVKFDPSLPE